MAIVSLNQKFLRKTLVLQRDQSDCGVACLRSLVRFYGGDYSLEILREISGTTRQGTTLLGLYQAANRIGFTAQGNEADIQALIDHKKPLILHVLLKNRLQHYLICYGFKNDRFIIGDPAQGIAYYTKEQVAEIWKSKSCLTLAPNEQFIKIKNLNANKKEWFFNLLKKDYILLRFSIILGMAIAILGMAMAIFSQKLIDYILPSKNYTKLIAGIILIAFLLVVRVGFSAIREYFLIQQSKDFNNRIIDRFFDALLQLHMPFFDTRKIGELVARLNDTQRIQRVIKTIVGNIIIDALIVLVSFIFLFYYSWQTGIISLISLPFYFYILYSFNTKILNTQKEVMQGYASSESHFISTMQGMATIKNNNKQLLFQKLNQNIYGSFQEKVFRLGKINIKLMSLSGIFSVLFLIAILFFNATQVYKDTLQLGELMAILGIAGSVLPSIASLALVAIPINEANVAFNRMFEYASAKKEHSGKTKIDTLSSLKIQNLSFRFAGRSQLLKNINLEIRQNQCVAMVGESGSGKSTLGQILQRFYTFESGEIIINNHVPLQDIELSHWRTHIGVVPQEITIFNGTVVDNIVLGSDEDPEKVILFCQEYGFHPFIAQLPQGYATLVGEEGINLSGGQKQLIALARALYRKPSFLMLDEPTAALDRNTEKFVLALLQQLKSKLSIFFISHRLHTLKDIADSICILENGRIAAQGSHKELLTTANFYSHYWKEVEFAGS